MLHVYRRREDEESEQSEKSAESVKSSEPADAINARRELDDEATWKRWTREQMFVRRDCASYRPNRTKADKARVKGVKNGKAIQCRAKRADGSQCELRTWKHGPECWIHTRINDGLCVKPSSNRNAGNGLFTLEARAKDEIICEFMGEHVRSDDKEGLDPKTRGIDFDAPGKTQPTYAIKTEHWLEAGVREEINPWRPTAGVARYINDGRRNRRSDRQPNVRIVNDEKHPGRLFVQATKAIAANKELWTHYGEKRDVDDEPEKQKEPARKLAWREVGSATVKIEGLTAPPRKLKPESVVSLLDNQDRRYSLKLVDGRELQMAQRGEQFGIGMRIVNNAVTDEWAQKYNERLTPDGAVPIIMPWAYSLAPHSWRRLSLELKEKLYDRLRALATHSFLPAGAYLIHGDLANVQNIVRDGAELRLIDWGKAELHPDINYSKQYYDDAIARLQKL